MALRGGDTLESSKPEVWAAAVIIIQYPTSQVTSYIDKLIDLLVKETPLVPRTDPPLNLDAIDM